MKLMHHYVLKIEERNKKRKERRDALIAERNTPHQAAAKARQRSLAKAKRRERALAARAAVREAEHMAWRERVIQDIEASMARRRARGPVDPDARRERMVQDVEASIAKRIARKAERAERDATRASLVLKPRIDGRSKASVREKQAARAERMRLREETRDMRRAAKKAAPLPPTLPPLPY